MKSNAGLVTRLVSGLAALICALSACTGTVSTSPEAQGEEGSAIEGGRKVASTDPIAHIAVAVVDASAGNEQFCTGIVVDRDLVLSAAHCFDDTHVPYVRPGNTGTPIRVRAIAVHGQYSETRRKRYDTTIAKVSAAADITTPSTPLYDLALLVLDSPLPASFTPAVFANTTANLANASLVSAGFGCTSTACTGTGDALRKVTMHFVTTAPAADLVVLEAGARHGSCFGDSGGPDFIVKTSGLEVLSMISTGPESCEAGISVDTLIAPFTPWIHASTAPLRSGKTSSGYTLVTF